MKKTRKLVPAIALLMVSVLMLSTASYAWFSMNTKVTATGMQITAKSDNTWLVIQEGDTFNPATTTLSVTSTASATELFPVAPATAITSDNVETPGSWHYAYSNDPAVSAKDGEYITNTTLTDYVASETFSIGLSDKSGAEKADHLQLTAVTLPTDTGISVVVVCGDNAYTHTASATGLTENLFDNLTTTGTTVTVYYFVNGDDEAVYTNNIAALTGIVTLTFEGVND